MTQSEVYQALIRDYGAENFGDRCRARDALYNEYGFVPDVTRITIYESIKEEHYIRFGVGRHVYEVTGDRLEKVQ